MTSEQRRQWIDNLRRTTMAAVLRATGAHPDARDQSKWRTTRGVLSVNTTKFINWNNAQGGGGAIDAISCATIYPDQLCISTSGARPNPAWLPPLLTQGWRIQCVFDADTTGNRIAQAMITISITASNASARHATTGTTPLSPSPDNRP